MFERKRKGSSKSSRRYKIFHLVRKEKNNLIFVNQENKREIQTISADQFLVRKEKYSGSSNPLFDLL